MGYIENNLIEGEQIVTIIHNHIINYIGLILSLFVVALFFYFLTPLLAIIPIVIIPLGILGLATSEYGITNHRIIKKYGIIGQSMSDIKIDKIDSITVKQNSLGRILRYGNVIINGTNTAIVFEYVPNPHEIRKQILELKREIH